MSQSDHTPLGDKLRRAEVGGWVEVTLHKFRGGQTNYPVRRIVI